MLIGRVLPVIRTFISLPAGIAGMAPVRFGIYTTIGCIPWTAALATAGYAVGSNWQSIVNAFHGPTYIIAAVVVLAIVVGVWRYLRRRPAAAEPDGAVEPDGPAAGRPRGRTGLTAAGRTAGAKPGEPAKQPRHGTHRR